MLLSPHVWLLQEEEEEEEDEEEEEGYENEEEEEAGDEEAVQGQGGFWFILVLAFEIFALSLLTVRQPAPLMPP